MNDEQNIIAQLVESLKDAASVQSVIRYNIEGKAVPATKESFWKHLVLSLLTSQQRSTKDGPVDLFEKKDPFPLALQTYETVTSFATRNDEEILTILKHFRFGKAITGYLRTNYIRLFGQNDLWPKIKTQLDRLLEQRNSPPSLCHKDLEREVAHILADRLKGIGPKQSRNLLQWLGLTRYETPLDSRVVGWLGDNLNWNIFIQSLQDDKVYEFWLDRLQSVCDAAGVLPAVFDALAFEKGSEKPTPQNHTTRIGYVNKNGQVVIRNTRMHSSDNSQFVFQLGCSHCGDHYEANGNDIFERKCIVCQGEQ